jgi:hypothetical protein
MIGQLETAASKRHFRIYYFNQLLIKQICINAALGPQKITRQRSIVQTDHNNMLFVLILPKPQLLNNIILRYYIVIV